MEGRAQLGDVMEEVKTVRELDESIFEYSGQVKRVEYEDSKPLIEQLNEEHRERKEREEAIQEAISLGEPLPDGFVTRSELLWRVAKELGVLDNHTREPIPTKEVVAEFLESHKNVGSKKRTIVHYCGVLERFATEYPELPLEPKAIEAFISPWEGATRADYLKVVGRLYRFLIKRGRISVDPTQVVHRPKPTTKLVPSLSREELRRILALPPDQLSKRDRTVIMFLSGTGLRVGEAINLTFSCINQDTLKVPKEGKTGERLVPLRVDIRDALLALKDGHRDDDPIFWSGHLNRPLTHEAGFRQICRKAFEAAGIKGVRASPHTLRHTFARNWITNGGDVISLMRILGHKNITTTQQYVYQVAGDLVEKNEKHNPLIGLETSLSSKEHRISSEDDKLPL